MLPFRRLAFLLTLLTFLPACSGYRTVAVPGEISPVESLPKGNNLKVGSSVRIWLKSGRKETGDIFEVTDQSITLAKPSNYGLKKTTILFMDIEKIEVTHISGLESVVVNTLGITLLVATAGIILLAWAMKDVQFGN